MPEARELNSGIGWLRFALALLAVLAIALGLRFLRLDAPSFWSDELFQIRDAVTQGATAGYAETRWGMTLSGVDTGALEPLGYASWREQGVNEWNARISSAVIGAFSALLLAWFSAGWLGRGPALLLGLLLALHPWHISWSQSARFYAPMFLYLAGALALYYESLRRRSPFGLAFAMMLAVLAVDAKPTGLMLFGVIGLDLLRRIYVERSLLTRSRVLMGTLVGGSVLALGAGVLAWAIEGGSYAEFATRNLGVSSQRLIAGNLYLTGPTLCALAATGVLLGWRRQRDAMLYALAATLVPILTFAVLANFLHVEIRYSFPSLYGWCALAALGGFQLFQLLRERAGVWVAAVPTLIVLISMLHADLIYYGPGYGYRPRWRDAYQYVAARRTPEQGVIGLSSWTGRFYLGSDDVRNVDLEFEGLSHETRDTWFVVKASAQDRDPTRRHFLDDVAELRAVFATRIAYPQDSIRVYLWRAPRDGNGAGR